MKLNELGLVLQANSEGRPKGGEKLDRLLKYAEQKGELRIFVPWAAPPTGRDWINVPEGETLLWLFGKDGLTKSLGDLVRVEPIVMPADSYAHRNGFDMIRANCYWSSVKKCVSELDEATFLPSSSIEELPVMSRYLAEEAYALERLNPKTANKVMEAAQKYTGASYEDAYESAAEYTMQRAAEGRFVYESLNALWVSLNWPERDAMCEDTPRIYVPESIRTPWLKEV